MPKRLAVFVGAGASYDLMGANASKVNSEFRPPLTREVFGAERFLEILDTCPGARALASTIGIRVSSGKPLEEVLRELRDTPAPHIKRQYRQVPVYLQRLFLNVSTNFTKEPVNYTYLLNSILASDYDEVMIVTTNYDTLLEQAILSVTRREIRTLDDYLADSRTQLVKLHGSIDWGWPVPDAPTTLGNLEEFVRYLDRCDPEVRLDTAVLKMDNPYKVRHPKGQVVYPALSVPVAGKYAPICPESHTVAARSFMRHCPDVLMLGMSGKDDDVTDLLKQDEDLLRLTVVSTIDAVDVLKRLGGRAPIVMDARTEAYRGGFTGFLTSGKLELFLNNER